MRTEQWIPVAMTAGRDCDDIQTGTTYRGDPLPSESQAWAEARRMCDRLSGVGFGVKQLNSREVH